MLLYAIFAVLSVAVPQLQLPGNSSSPSNGTASGGTLQPRTNVSVAVIAGVASGNSSMPSNTPMTGNSGNSSMPSNAPMTGNSSMTSGSGAMSANISTVNAISPMSNGNMMASNSSFAKNASMLISTGNMTTANSSYIASAGAVTAGNGTMASGSNMMSSNSSKPSSNVDVHGSSPMQSSSVPKMSTDVFGIYGNALATNTLGETIEFIFRSSNVNETQNVMDMIMGTMAANLNTATAWKVLIALGGEIDASQRRDYFESVVPRIAGLHRKMNMIAEKLALMYGFTGDSAQNYSKLIRAMQLSSIVSSALMAAGNNTSQYKQVETMAKQLGVVSNAGITNNVPVSAVIGIGGARSGGVSVLQPGPINSTASMSSINGTASAASLGAVTNATGAGAVPVVAPTPSNLTAAKPGFSATGSTHHFFA
ncbi:hypothetical protein V3C99_017050 [Haemonchus contortus]|uniref:DUF1216 domain-containing protein n=1 Tax=Haemonchus contortus TaxID=6289 RepID=A0A7I4Z1T1_HAECO